MKPVSVILAPVLLAALPVIHAQTVETVAPVDPYRRMALVGHFDALDHGLQDWSGLRLELGNTTRKRSGVYGALVQERRFGEEDTGVEAGAALAFGDGWMFQPELSIAPGSHFLPRNSLDLRLTRELGGGWVGSGSIGRRHYRDADVDRAALQVERYVGAWRWSYQLNLGRLRGRDSAGHDLRLAREYGERSEIGVLAAFGQEPSVLGSGLVTANVRAFGLFGRHAFDPNWALLWNAGSVRQGDFYTRHGIVLGIERRF